uniref:Polypeptide N-acetylgalactosaminyltransferase-like 6 n=1 Tax=Steinernema glaseri TaxID=37863 RepID=A0A1I7YKZ9_9BILA
MVPLMPLTGRRLRIVACALAGLMTITTIFELVNYFMLHEAEVTVLQYPFESKGPRTKGEAKGEPNLENVSDKKGPAEEEDSDGQWQKVEHLLSEQPDQCNLSTTVVDCLPGLLGVPLLEKYFYDKRTGLMACAINNNYEPYVRSSMCYLIAKKQPRQKKSLHVDDDHQAE